MKNESSPILTANVTLGSAVSKRKASRHLRPWTILVCADLGFVSERPQPITAAGLRELLRSAQPSVSGVVDRELPAGIPPFHISHSITDLDDFSQPRLIERLPYLEHIRGCAAILDDVSRKKITPGRGMELISESKISWPVIQLLKNIVNSDMDKSGHDTFAAPQKAPKSKIDSILSMVDVKSEPQSPSGAENPADLVSSLIRSDAADRARTLPAKCSGQLDKLVTDLADVITRQPFFRSMNDSWNSLKTLLRIIGRRSDALVLLQSSPCEATARHLTDTLAHCNEAGLYPDLILWDYPVFTDTATMEQLERSGDLAQQHKALLVASIDRRDELYGKILAGEPLRAVLGSVAYLPFRRLRKKNAARCIALCAPQAEKMRHNSKNGIAVNAAWLFVCRLLASIVEYNSPFDLENGSANLFDEYLFERLDAHTLCDAAESGITLLQPAAKVDPRVLFDQEGGPWTSLTFNLMVNRTAKAAAEWVSGNVRTKVADAEAVCEELRSFLVAELETYHILSSAGSVRVTVAEGDFLVTVDSDVAVGGSRAKFQFSL